MIPTVLVMGACTLDRLLSVASYPEPDSKIRTTAYHEYGGGNAANTATAMSRLGASQWLQSEQQHPLRIQLATKIGSDSMGELLKKELLNDGVDLCNPLFVVSQDRTTSVTTVIVSHKDTTRTCMYTPGTCGELTMADIEETTFDDILKDVVHFHSDSRHTDAALVVAKEAKRRGISVSVDAEKDRHTTSLDELLVLADTIFTNSGQIDEYLTRRSAELITERSMTPLVPSLPLTRSCLDDKETKEILHLLRPSIFYSQFYQQARKEVVVSKGNRGALAVVCQHIDEVGSRAEDAYTIDSDSGLARMLIEHQFTINGERSFRAQYMLNTVGVIPVSDVVDTTGAGDAFIGAFLVSSLLLPSLDRECTLAFSSWVGGCKLGGPGARSAIPARDKVDRDLGVNVEQAHKSLVKLVGNFDLGQ